MTTNDEQLRRVIWKHIRSIQTCMMTTLDGTRMRARPMTGMARPEDVAIWFFTDRNSHKDTEILANPAACLSYVDNRNKVFVSVSGVLEEVTARDTIHDLWNEGAALYFPEGPDDPEIVLLKFTAQGAEFWDAPSSAVVMAIKFIEAKLTGERPDMGTNAKVSLSAEG